MSNERTCENCPNKFICPTFKTNGSCIGWGDRELFIGLLKFLLMRVPEEYIESGMKIIKEIQDEAKKIK